MTMRGAAVVFLSLTTYFRKNKSAVGRGQDGTCLFSALFSDASRFFKYINEYLISLFEIEKLLVVGDSEDVWFGS